MATNIAIALLLATLAGLSTAIGGLLGVIVRRPSEKFMSVALGFSAGVMIWVAFVELLQEGVSGIGAPAAYVGLFIGVGVMFLVDVLIPHEYLAERVGGLGKGVAAPGECPLPMHRHRGRHRYGQNVDVLKCGLLVAVGMAIHNFPEGLATFASAAHDTSLGLAIAVAVGIHNIPEGLAVSVPIYAATGSRRRAFFWSALPGSAELAGAALAAIVLMPFLSTALLGWVLAIVAGVMIFISLDELVPVACSMGENHLSIVGVTLGMAVMAISLQLLHG